MEEKSISPADEGFRDAERISIMNLNIFFILLFFTIASSLLLPVLHLIRCRNTRLETEHGLVPLHEEICGGRFDSLGLLDLFHNNLLAVRLSLYDRFLVISYRKKIVLNYLNILEIKISGSIPQDPFQPESAWNTLSIVHGLEGISKRIDLHPSDCKKVKDMIEKLIRG